jgi:hypothetical protein
VLGVNPVESKLVEVDCPIWAKLLQFAPEHRSMRYSATPTLSVDADHVRLTCVGPTAVAVRPVGAVGFVVSGAGVAADAIAEYALKLGTASAARTRNRYVVLAASPVDENPTEVDVPTWTKFVQLAPEQRSMRYSATPTLSVDAFHARSIRLVLTAVAVTPVGADGGVVSGPAAVVAVEVLE